MQVSSKRKSPSSHVAAALAGLLVLGAIVLAVAGCGGTGSASLAVTSESHHSRIDEERPPHPQHLDVATPAQERAATQTRSAPPPPAETAPPPVPTGENMPAASAGTNGSYTPPRPSEQTQITPRTIEKMQEEEAEGRAILLNGIALAPPGAPEAVQAMVSAANEIVGRPYIWGGGHQSWYSRGYDCSGAVSYALAGGGLLTAPLDSSQLERWGAPGPGRWITVYANAGHAYAVVAGLRWDTVGDAEGTGPRWHAAVAYPEGFVARHPPGF